MGAKETPLDDMVRLLRANWSLGPNGAGDGAVATAAVDPVHIEVDLVRNPEVCIGGIRPADARSGECGIQESLGMFSIEPCGVASSSMTAQSLSAEAEDIEGVRRIGGGGIGFPRWDELLCRHGTTPSRVGTYPGEKESLLLICTLLSFFRMLETMSAADGTPLGRA